MLAALALLLHEFLSKGGPPVPSTNRTVILLVLGYCAYQVAVILPVSVIFLHDLDPVSVVRAIEKRIALMLIPFIYLVALKYLSPRRMILLVNAAAVLLALYAVYRYATVGPIYDSGTRLRMLWGGATLPFAS